MSTAASTDETGDGAGAGGTDLLLEVVVLPVADVDRAKAFYGGLGWRLDADFAAGDAYRIVQFTPPGSPCSIQFGTGVTTAAPGSARSTYLVVSDIGAAVVELAARGAEVSEVFHEGEPGGRFRHQGDSAWAGGASPERQTYGSFATFADPDGNSWLVQEITERLPGRVEHPATTFRSVGELAAALRRAAAAHGEHESRTGHADPDWPDWYAEFMVREQAGAQLPT